MIILWLLHVHFGLRGIVPVASRAECRSRVGSSWEGLWVQRQGCHNSWNEVIRVIMLLWRRIGVSRMRRRIRSRAEIQIELPQVLLEIGIRMVLRIRNAEFVTIKSGWLVPRYFLLLVLLLLFLLFLLHLLSIHKLLLIRFLLLWIGDRLFLLESLLRGKRNRRWHLLLCDRLELLDDIDFIGTHVLVLREEYIWFEFYRFRVGLD